MLLNTHLDWHIFADTSRHFLPVDVIKQIIESMSYTKLVRVVTWYSFQSGVSQLNFTQGLG